MKLGRWKKLNTETKFANKWWSYRIDKYLFPNGREGDYHYAFTFGSVFIIPVDSEGKILMVRQFRYLNDRFSIEFPGGGVKKENNYDYEARKELIEETGFDGDLKYKAEFNPFNGVTNEICKVYTARNLRPSDEFKKDESEEFELLRFDAEEIERLIESNEIYDGMTLASWALIRRFLTNN